MNLDKIAPEEIVDGFMLPAQMSPEERLLADQQLGVIRQQRIAERTEEEKLLGKLLQLKIHIVDYIREDTFDPKKNFAYFFKTYIGLQNKKKNEVALELDIHKSKLSQLLSGSRQPSQDIFIRLEFHSNQLITAREWLRLSVKQQEHAVMTNTSLRNKESKHVKNQVKEAYQA